MILKNKVAIVTGGSQGIGRAICNRFKEEGAIVISGDISNDDKITKDKDDIINIHLDITNEKSIKKLKKYVIGEFGKVDILVNNAGICKPFIKFEEMEERDWDTILDINLKGTIKCVKEFLPIFKKNKYGKIINNASSAAITGGISVSPAYAVSKAGVVCLTKSLAKYLASYNINVNSMTPGIISTDMTKDLEYNIESIPLKRFGEPEDIANAALFLASDDSSYLTGITLDINGGLYTR